MFEQSHNYTPESFITEKILFISGMSILGINYGMGLLLSFFICFDTLFGIAKSISLYGWASINANRFWIGIMTKIGILFIPISIAVSGSLLGFDLTYLVSLSMYTLIANDAISCYTNILSIKKKKDYENKDLIEMLINFLRGLLYNSIKNMMQKIKDGNACDIDDKKDENKPERN
jgi:hypothetical protein